MGNLLNFPFKASNSPLGSCHQNPADSGDGVGTQGTLLSALAVLREQLDRAAFSTTSPLDDELILRCQNAAEVASCAAAKAERTLHRHALKIEEMERLACTDPLTDTYNRRGFQKEFERILAAADRYDETGVLIYVDLDGFKPINDTYGHAAGDLVLCEVARTLNENIRPHDLLARLGGDEFAVLLTRTGWKNGLQRAEFLKHALNTLYVAWKDKHIAVRASFGFQRFGANDCHKTLLMKADHAMYEAKRLRTTTPKPEL